MKILCFEIKYVGFGNRDKEWKQLVREGQYVDAIRACRISRGIDRKGNIKISLGEARIKVDLYRACLGADNG